MAKGKSGIPALELEVLNKLIDKMPTPPNLFFSNMFGSTQYESDTIRWEIEYGSAGMTPFVAPGSVAPAVGHDGIGEASARAAFYKEKMYFDEEFLNNLREPGSWATYQTAERKLARGAQKLDMRLSRRREWMMCKMFVDGTLTYIQKGGTKFSVSYGVPTAHRVTLTGNNIWGTGSTRNPVRDIFDAKLALQTDAGVTANFAICNSATLRLLMFDSTVQALLQKSTFGNGDLFANPGMVLGTILGVGTLIIYDEMYEVPAWLTAAVTGSSTTVVSVDDASDFEAGGTLRFHDMSVYNTYEDETISSVDAQAGTVTVSSAPTLSFLAGEDRVTMRKKFIADNKFCLLATNVDGAPVAEFMEAPYGLGRRWGRFADTKMEWDPEEMWLRVQDKGLPVLYNPDTTYVLTVV